jgi:hypothetical protein
MPFQNQATLQSRLCKLLPKFVNCFHTSSCSWKKRFGVLLSSALDSVAGSIIRYLLLHHVPCRSSAKCLFDVSKTSPVAQIHPMRTASLNHRSSWSARFSNQLNYQNPRTIDFDMRICLSRLYSRTLLEQHSEELRVYHVSRYGVLRHAWSFETINPVLWACLRRRSGPRGWVIPSLFAPSRTIDRCTVHKRGEVLRTAWLLKVPVRPVLASGTEASKMTGVLGIGRTHDLWSCA